MKQCGFLLTGLSFLPPSSEFRIWVSAVREGAKNDQPLVKMGKRGVNLVLQKRNWLDVWFPSARRKAVCPLRSIPFNPVEKHAGGQMLSVAVRVSHCPKTDTTSHFQPLDCLKLS